jgi:hypothetical protein
LREFLEIPNFIFPGACFLPVWWGRRRQTLIPAPAATWVGSHSLFVRYLFAKIVFLAKV